MERYSMFLSWKINIVKMTIQPKIVYRFNAIPIKLPMAFFTELEQKISQFIWKHKDPEKPKQSWERRMDLEESTFLTSDYTTRLLSSRTVWYWHRNRKIDQWNKIENPEKKPRYFWSVNLWQRRQDYTMLKRQSFQQMMLGKLDSYMLKKEEEIRSFFNTIHKNKLRMN